MVDNLIKELGPIKNILDPDFIVVGSLVDVIYLNIDRKIKDIDLVYFGHKDINKEISGLKESVGNTLGKKFRKKLETVYLEIFVNCSPPEYTYFSLYDIKVQTRQCRYNFITNFLKIEEKRGWTKIYRSWFRTKKQYFNLLKTKYEYNILD